VSADGRPKEEEEEADTVRQRGGGALHGYFSHPHPKTQPV